MNRLKIAIAAAEVAPLAKTGGLADVSAALAQSLAARGHDVRLFMPLYRRLRTPGREFQTVPGMERLKVRLGSYLYFVTVRATPLPSGFLVYCLDCPELFDREGIYTADPDEHRRFALLSRGVLSACQSSNWAPDILHANDWHTGMLPLYARLLSSWDRLFRDTKVAITIHNLGYQGSFPGSIVPDLGLGESVHLLHQDDLKNDRVSFLTSGLLYADVITTVSRTYAREIQTAEQGWGLDGLLRRRSSDLVGIVNGVDTDVWSPEKDARIPRNYSVNDLAGKEVNKRVLLKSLGLPYDPHAPVFGIVSRLTYQKGFELLFNCLPAMLQHHRAQLTVLGSGEDKYEDFFRGLQRRFPRQVCYYRGYSEDLAHLIEAGADMFLMPSRFEPCGLNQMYSLRYGTIPIVRKTGGLADTVQLYDPTDGTGTGIVFEHFKADAMAWALKTGLQLYHQPQHWGRMVRNAMVQDYSWERQSAIYEELYRAMIAKRR